MIMNPKSLLYISGHNPDTDTGVEKKVQDLCAVARRFGYSAKVICHYPRTLSERRDMLRQMLDSDAGVVVLRSFNAFNLRCRRLLKQAKRQGRILVLDQPTPLASYMREIWGSSVSFGRKTLSALRLLINGPWGQRVFDRIIQYGNESWFFSLGNKSRTVLTGNGIDVSRMDLRSPLYSESGSLRLVGVASSVSPWQGFDRIIKAMGMLRKKGSALSVEFEVVGDCGGSHLKDLAEREGVEDKVHFHGLRRSDYIGDLYSRCDLAVSSLGLFRKGLSTASVLKAREYCLAGIPFIACGTDPDFPSDVPFRFEVPNDESVEPIVDVMERFESERKGFADSQIRDYALEHLSYEHKFNEMMEGLV